MISVPAAFLAELFRRYLIFLQGSILRHIVTCCEQIEQTVERFGSSAEIFAADPIYRNAAKKYCLTIVDGQG